jgi:peroxiredoxin
MANTPSTMLPLGTPLPPFKLPDPDGQLASDQDLADDQPVLVMFLSNHCPFVRLVADVLAKVTAEYMAKGVGIVGINSNDVVRYPDDRPELMKEEAAQRGYRFPYLFDETQAVAKAYQAACTPDFYVFDRNRKLVYRGQMDGARPGNGVAPTASDLRLALDAVLTDAPVSAAQKPSIGCNIKWKPGNEPAYYG